MHPLEAMGWRVDMALLLLAERARMMNDARERAESEARNNGGGGGGGLFDHRGKQRTVSFASMDDFHAFVKSNPTIGR